MIQNIYTMERKKHYLSKDALVAHKMLFNIYHQCKNPWKLLANEVIFRAVYESLITRKQRPVVPYENEKKLKKQWNQLRSDARLWLRREDPEGDPNFYWHYLSEIPYSEFLHALEVLWKECGNDYQKSKAYREMLKHIPKPSSVEVKNEQELEEL